MSSVEKILAQFEAVASAPLQYAQEWKRRNGRPVVGVLPMNFPAELVDAFGALPLLLQEDDEQVTVGLSRVFNFYCGYNRSLTDQTLKDRLRFLDAVMLGDHCVQILGTADAMRAHQPDVPVLYDQLVSTINVPWAHSESCRVLGELKSQLASVLGSEASEQALRDSIGVFNHNRQLLRKLYRLRMEGKLALSASCVMHIVKASMVMDRREHSRLLESLLEQVGAKPVDIGEKIPLYLSGHMCHAPKAELLDLIESCGGVVVADDLFTGYRYISTDMEENGEPIAAMASWYLARNKRVPCPTRSAREYDWDEFLVDAVSASSAQGVIILMVKFCEPHMYYYPDIKERFEAHGIPHLMIETEHEEMPIEGLRTRLETFFEVMRHRSVLQR